MSDSKTVFCPVKKGQIDGSDCYLVCEVADGMLLDEFVPEAIVWNEDQRQKCLKCKYHDDVD